MLHGTAACIPQGDDTNSCVKLQSGLSQCCNKSSMVPCGALHVHLYKQAVDLTLVCISHTDCTLAVAAAHSGSHCTATHHAVLLLLGLPQLNMYQCATCCTF